ncbi:MAG TPA: hypothetical protein VED40_14030 [Azospirillaceae bacterium]|nr:hypothetical protein [Azospirillaceae bacterium]
MTTLLRATVLLLPMALAGCQSGGAPTQASGTSAPVTAGKSGIGLPAGFGGFRLTASNDAGGLGLDTVSSYKGPAGDITLYVYRPPFPDVHLTAFVASSIIRQRFAPGVEIAADELVTPAGASAPTLRRLLFTRGGETQPRDALAIQRAGPWLVKVRATLPGASPAELTKAIDTALASLSWPQGLAPEPLPPKADFAPCAPDTLSEVAALPADPAYLAVLGTLSVPSVLSSPPDDLSLPRPGTAPGGFCLDGVTRFGQYDIPLLRGSPAASKAGDVRHFIPLGDSGQVIEIGRYAMPSGVVPRPIVHARLLAVGASYVMELYDGWPNREQAASLVGIVATQAQQPLLTVLEPEEGKAYVTLNPERVNARQAGPRV